MASVLIVVSGKEQAQIALAYVIDRANGTPADTFLILNCRSMQLRHSDAEHLAILKRECRRQALLLELSIGNKHGQPVLDYEVGYCLGDITDAVGRMTRDHKLTEIVFIETPADPRQSLFDRYSVGPTRSNIELVRSLSIAPVRILYCNRLGRADW